MGIVDPSGIQISVEVRTARGATFQLWMGGATSGTGPDAESIFLDAGAEFQDLPIVTSVNIELMRGYNATVTIELGATYDLGLSLLESDLFIIGNTIITQISYPRIGLPLPAIACLSVKPSISLNGDIGLTATLNGQGGVFAGLRSTSEVVRQNVSVKEAIEDIANLEHNKWIVEFPEQQRVDPQPPSEANQAAFSSEGQDPNDPLYRKRNALSQAGRTDWAELRSLCENVGCKPIVRPDTQAGEAMRVVIQRDAEAARRDPVYTLTSRGQIDMKTPNGRFPLLSLESEAEGVWFQRGRTTRTRDTSHETGDVTPEIESNQETQAEQIPPAVTGGVTDGSAEQDGVNVSVGNGQQFVSTPDSSTETSPQERAERNAREQGERGAGLNVNVSTIGNPLAFPGDRITLENVGLFSGNYEINSMSHAVGEGDWTTSMELIRRGGFNTEFYSELVRRTQDWDAADQPPSGQVEIQEDAQGGGDITVDPVDVSGGG